MRSYRRLSMWDYIKFWMAKDLAQFGLAVAIGLVIVAGLFVVAGILTLVGKVRRQLRGVE